MYTGLQYLLDKLVNLPDELEGFTNVVMNDDDTTDKILDLNREQLDAGIRADGSDIEPEYKPYTVDVKTSKGQPTDRVTLRDTGAFYRGLRVKNTPGATTVIGTDEKTEGLEFKYNRDGEAVILGLAQISMEKLRAYILPEYISFTKNYLSR